jgi:cyclopropane fatty-acyl-phospholipid synthase-like methyltransferase
LYRKEGSSDVQLTFEQIFKYTDFLNPISLTTLLIAGKLAQMNPNKTVLDLGSGKGYPSLLWASVFGVHVKGVDFNRTFVDHAASRAKILSLSSKTKYICQDLKDFRALGNYDIVAMLGLDFANIYGGRVQELQHFRSSLTNDGALILAEPVWLETPLPKKVLEALGANADSFVTVP